MARTHRLSAFLLAGSMLVALIPIAEAGQQAATTLAATVTRTSYGVPIIVADTDYDALYALGYVHAEDRFFQMDVLRRTFSGTLAELVGTAAISQDVQFRTLGLRRAAEASESLLSEEADEWLEAYTAGVNAYLASGRPLPPEYAALELTAEGVSQWRVLDSLVIMKGITFGLSFDLGDLDYTQALLAFVAAGQTGGFNGAALFSEDLYRSAPFDPTVSIPASELKRAPEHHPARLTVPSYLGQRTRQLIEQYRNTVKDIPLLANALNKRDTPTGSNWWIISGDHTASGHPILANDPHLALDTPATFYEVSLQVRGNQPMEVFGVSFPGGPAVVQGCNPNLCWGSTVNPLDVTDIYQESLALDAESLLPSATVFDGELEPLTIIAQTFYANQLGDGVDDNITLVPVNSGNGGFTFVVPRRNNGPIIDFSIGADFSVLGLSVQYTGWSGTTEFDAFRSWARASDLDDFTAGLQYFDVGSQNWAYADTAGTIAYFTSAEMPIREDLQLLEVADGGMAPIFIRDGTHTLQHEWLAVTNPQPNQSLGFEILPFAEMPQVVNPAQGYLINANNDPVGTTIDNQPINQLREGGGIYYLSPGYASGFRAGRIQRSITALLTSKSTVTVEDMRQLQANNQLLDAEVFVPLLLAAYQRAGTTHEIDAGLDTTLHAADAIDLLANWDYSTPTGIVEGYDPGDDPVWPPVPGQQEVNDSVAATIYALWRSQMIRLAIDTPLQQLGLQGYRPSSNLAMSALRHLIDDFDQNQGVGASGVEFIPDGNLDELMLDALDEALSLLSGSSFDAAFAGSAQITDYRWGRLHRIVFDHVLGDPFSIPAAGGLSHLSASLPGVARAGGFGAVDASSHNVRADGVNEFMFGAGPNRRFIGQLNPAGITLEQVIPGGASGVLGDPHQADSLLLWLTNQYVQWSVGVSSHRRPTSRESTAAR